MWNDIFNLFCLFFLMYLNVKMITFLNFFYGILGRNLISMIRYLKIYFNRHLQAPILIQGRYDKTNSKKCYPILKQNPHILIYLFLKISHPKIYFLDLIAPLKTSKLLLENKERYKQKRYCFLFIILMVTWRKIKYLEPYDWCFLFNCNKKTIQIKK